MIRVNANDQQGETLPRAPILPSSKASSATPNQLLIVDETLGNMHSLRFLHEIRSTWIDLRCQEVQNLRQSLSVSLAHDWLNIVGIPEQIINSVLT